jgi:peptide deformylase
MILPVTLYGDPVLKKKAEAIAADFQNLEEVIKNMWQTMYVASGVGLAAPQVGMSIRLFVVDTEQLAEKRKKRI